MKVHIWNRDILFITISSLEDRDRYSCEYAELIRPRWLFKSASPNEANVGNQASPYFMCPNAPDIGCLLREHGWQSR